MVQTDSTYKLVWQGYPVMLVGTSDKMKIFHPFAIAICQSERASDFAFIFDALQNYILNWHLRILLADGSDAITSGFESVFGTPAIRLTCFFHVKQNLEKYFKLLRKCPEYLNHKRDIFSLQTSKDEKTFCVATGLFLKKWSSKKEQRIKERVAYFNSEWLEQCSNWYKCIAIRYQSTNNGIKGTNGVLKKDFSLYERLPVGQFLRFIADVLTQWSKARMPGINCIPFHKRTSPSLTEWTETFQWVRCNHKVVEEDDDWKRFYMSLTRAKVDVSMNILPRKN